MDLPKPIRRKVKPLVIGRKTPQMRARELLLDNLTASQVEEYRKDGGFTVESSGERYKLSPTITVRESDNRQFCAVAPELPADDQLLARKLMLENSPDEFFKVANSWCNESRPFSMRADGTSARNYTAAQTMYRAAVPLPSDEEQWRQALEYARRYFVDRGFAEERLRFECVDDPIYHSVVMRIRYGNRYATSTIAQEHLMDAYSAMDIYRLTIERLCEQLTRDILRNYGK